MRPPSFIGQSWKGRHLKVTRFTPNDLDTKIRDAIARRAFQISESRGFAPGHEMEDWRRAESEVVRPLNCGFLVSDNKIELTTDAACFDEGEIEVCAEPWRLVICGTDRACKPGKMPERNASHAGQDVIFRSLKLPHEVLPSQATARFKGRILEIDLPTAQRMQAVRTLKNAA